jgi:FKBP-type peptidyl-prolyl cis-trans isomerase
MKSLFLSLFIVLFISCNSDDDSIPVDYSAENEIEITEYLQENNISATRTDSGLYYTTEEIGNGAEISATTEVSMRLKVLNTAGDVFFDDSDQIISVILQEALISWREGFQKFNVGGIGTLIAPAHLAYGDNEINGIPAGSVVIFEFKLVDVAEENEQEILDYIYNNNLEDVLSSESGLYYQINEQGEGAEPLANSNVTVAYKGYFTDGEVFDESSTDGATFNLGGVIPGWTEGIQYFNEGGSGLLFVPSHLGYGKYNYNTIPGSSVLIFEVSLKSVN